MFAKFGSLVVMPVTLIPLLFVSTRVLQHRTSTDVGGGSVPNNTENSLARISLRWMILECFRTGTGIRFRKDALKRLGMNQGTLASPSDGLFTVERARPGAQRFATEKTVVPTSTSSMPPTEQKNEELRYDSIKGTDTERGILVSKGDVSGPAEMFEGKTPSTTGSSAFKTEIELKDALSPIYDQLKIWKLWWLPEIVPLRHRVHGIKNLKTLRGHHWSYVSHRYLAQFALTQFISTG